MQMSWQKYRSLWPSFWLSDIPASTSDGSQPPLTPAPGDPSPFFWPPRTAAQSLTLTMWETGTQNIRVENPNKMNINEYVIIAHINTIAGIYQISHGVRTTHYSMFSEKLSLLVRPYKKTCLKNDWKVIFEVKSSEMELVTWWLKEVAKLVRYLLCKHEHLT